MEWAEEKQVLAGMFEELASTVRDANSGEQAAPAFLRVMLAGTKMLGDEFEMLVSMVALPFGGIEALQEKVSRKAGE